VEDASHRKPIGQLLGDAVIRFRRDLYARAKAASYDDVREVHLQVFGAIDWKGTRLRDLAARANMTPPAMAELVDDLQSAGYLERVPDPSDGRAKLVRPTRAGRRILAGALRAVEDIEREYADRLGRERFEELVQALEELALVNPGERRQTSGRSALRRAERPARNAEASVRSRS
jgi:DNA-binding MarR family transcriptional regulator